MTPVTMYPANGGKRDLGVSKGTTSSRTLSPSAFAAKVTYWLKDQGKKYHYLFDNEDQLYEFKWLGKNQIPLILFIDALEEKVTVLSSGETLEVKNIDSLSNLSGKSLDNFLYGYSS